MFWTSTDIIESLRMRGIIPRAQSAFDNERFLQIMTEEMIYYLVPKLMSVREAHFLTFEDIPLVQGQSEYEIPSRAIAQKTKSVWFVNQSGKAERLVMRDAERELYYQTESANQPKEYYFKDTKIVLLPKVNSGIGAIRVYYYKRPNRIVELSKVGRITAIAGNEISINNVPTEFVGSAKYDLVRGKPNFVNLFEDTPVVQIAADTFTFDSVPDGVAVGDYLCLEGQSPIPQIPYEAFKVLIMKSLMIVLRSQNDAGGSDRADKDFQEAEKEMLNLFSERSDDDSKSIQSDRGLGALFTNTNAFNNLGW